MEEYNKSLREKGFSEALVLNIIMNNSHDTVYFKDKDSNYILSSRAHSMQFGYEDPSQIIGKNDFDFFPRKFAEDAREDEITIMETGQPIIGKIEKWEKKDKPTIWFSASKYPFYNEKGEILHVDDSKLIQKAIRYGVAPIMVLNEMSASPEEVRGITHTILNNQALQNDLINNLINTLDRSGYYGVDFISPYILPADRPLYVEFIERLSSRLHLEGYKVFLSMTICIFEMVANIVYEDLQLERLGQCVDKVMFISYEGGYAFGISQGLIAYDTSNNRLNYVTGKINPEKTMFGISTIGYDWKLPYIGGVSKGQAISYNSAIELAREFNAEIKFDDVTKFSYFQYATNYDYVVRFKDARGIDVFVGLVPIHGINGVGLWNIMYFMAPMWLVINSQYEIEKVLQIRI